MENFRAGFFGLKIFYAGFFWICKFLCRIFLHPEFFKLEIFGFENFLTGIFFAIEDRFPLHRTGFPPEEI
jgi:hypothetical protein